MRCLAWLHAQPSLLFTTPRASRPTPSRGTACARHWHCRIAARREMSQPTTQPAWPKQRSTRPCALGVGVGPRQIAIHVRRRDWQRNALKVGCLKRCACHSAASSSACGRRASISLLSCATTQSDCGPASQSSKGGHTLERKGSGISGGEIDATDVRVIGQQGEAVVLGQGYAKSQSTFCGKKAAKCCIFHGNQLPLSSLWQTRRKAGTQSLRSNG